MVRGGGGEDGLTSCLKHTEGTVTMATKAQLPKLGEILMQQVVMTMVSMAMTLLEMTATGLRNGMRSRWNRTKTKWNGFTKHPPPRTSGRNQAGEGGVAL